MEFFCICTIPVSQPLTACVYWPLSRWLRQMRSWNLNLINLIVSNHVGLTAVSWADTVAPVCSSSCRSFRPGFAGFHLVLRFILLTHSLTWSLKNADIMVSLSCFKSFSPGNNLCCEATYRLVTWSLAESSSSLSASELMPDYEVLLSHPCFACMYLISTGPWKISLSPWKNFSNSLLGLLSNVLSISFKYIYPLQERNHTV